jgi:hypothetical protein
MTQGIHTVNKVTTMCSRKGTRKNARDTHCKQFYNYICISAKELEKTQWIHTKQVYNDVFPQRNKRNFAPLKQGIRERKYVFPAENISSSMVRATCHVSAMKLAKGTIRFLLGTIYSESY